MNIKELAGTIVTCAAAASLIYGAGIKTGLVIFVGRRMVGHVVSGQAWIGSA
jgi:hypothetical protein